MNEVERDVIAHYVAEGQSLRNIVFSPKYQGRSKLDGIISLEDQKHWALGDDVADPDSFLYGAERPLIGEPKLLKNRKANATNFILSAGGEEDPLPNWEAMLIDVAACLTAIPNAVELEKEFWTLSDLPSTSGGRFLTLSVGFLEVHYIPRHLESLVGPEGEFETSVSQLNFPLHSLTDAEDPTGQTLKSDIADEVGHLIAGSWVSKYPYSEIDCIAVPIGLVPFVLQSVPVRTAYQQLCLQLMRRSRAGLFRHWHSEDLATLAYERVVELQKSFPKD